MVGGTKGNKKDAPREREASHQTANELAMHLWHYLFHALDVLTHIFRLTEASLTILAECISSIFVFRIGFALAGIEI